MMRVMLVMVMALGLAGCEASEVETFEAASEVEPHEGALISDQWRPWFACMDACSLQRILGRDVCNAHPNMGQRPACHAANDAVESRCFRSCDIYSGYKINSDDDHLPGGCNNPVLCGSGGTTGGPFDNTGGGGGGGSGGGGTEYCLGCACTASPGQCRTCETRCGTDKFHCQANGGTGCGEIYSSCMAGCGGRGLTCVCPGQR